MRRLIHPLDRYVFTEFWKIFVTTALGFPILVIVINLTDNLDKYLARNLATKDIILSYLFWIPESMFMVLPAAVLFATIFTIGGLTRHSEITAAKASGISFYRVIRPIFLGAVMATVLGLGLGEVVPRANAKREELLQEQRFRTGNDRFNFTSAGEAARGRVYKIQALNVEQHALSGVEIERKGRDAAYPTYLISTTQATWTPAHGWLLKRGNMHVLPDSMTDFAFTFDSLRDNLFTEQPIDLMSAPKAPVDMGYEELGRFIKGMERSGADVNELRVERMLKLAIPVTCVVILLFGAPLATSTQRGGAAYGIGVSLATTVIFLMLIQLTKAVGGRGLIPPDIAAWMPSALFGVVGLIMLARVRT